VPGKVADLLVVGGDPLGDIRILQDPARLWLVSRAGAPWVGVTGKTRTGLVKRSA
jgi:imidazolonepropionase-like amidohydrolase